MQRCIPDSARGLRHPQTIVLNQTTPHSNIWTLFQFFAIVESMNNQDITLAHVSVSEMDNNCYLLCIGKEALLIDAADNPQALLDLAAENNVSITAVLSTHSHWDHLRALPQILEQTDAKHFAPQPDAADINAPVDVLLTDSDVLPFAGHHFPVHILHGHTTGGAAIAVPIGENMHLFVGDSLFPGGIGKTENHQDFIQLLDDVSTKLFQKYPDDTVVHPGHGKSTTLGAERPHLEEWRARGW
ncbi:MBL fold metallo-hydrolase [Corynebacterium pseudotuberculosis]|uniref:MBL fold metallo-hydrolase n=1 Tax=Corynebacterium pseudotuberculosis TaxID=1719 RepID=UPI0009C04A44|nr:MBL fold metallo-hydrolase [Corynebacterium pseudotuberculosis]AFH90767.2 MBL fold metallo-hydrolase [Corynebacterium pseudotuberculosis 31]